MEVPFDNTTALQTDLYRGWMPSPNTRCTTDILWTCLATVLLCVYTAVHLNVPEPGEAALQQALRRAKWIVLAILAPELVLGIAWRQFTDARHLEKRLREHASRYREESAKTPKTTLHPEACKVVSGVDKDLEKEISKVSYFQNVAELSEIPDEEEITLTYSFYAIMGGFRLSNTPDVGGAGTSFSVTPLAIDKLAQHGVFWTVSTTSIQDKSKADSLAKLLTVLQVLWMLIQCIARKISALPVTLLEIHVSIHAICAALMFILWFKKPLDIRDATIKNMPLRARSIVQSLIDDETKSDNPLPPLVVRQVNYGRGWRSKMSLWNRLNLFELPIFLALDNPGLDDKNGSLVTIRFLGVCISQFVYGCLHMVAWNLTFPSKLEEWFWRASCIGIACTYSIEIVIVSVMILLNAWTKKHRMDSGEKPSSVSTWASLLCRWIANIINGILALTWTGARLFIVIESLISLRVVPTGVYAAVQWSNYIPHI